MILRVYLTADADGEYESSAYAYRVGNFPIQSEKHFGWTVAEAYLHGLLSLSNYIIRRNIFSKSVGFDFCTGSKQVIRLITTDRLYFLHDHDWHDPDGPVFYIPVLKELYYHKRFYEEREIRWTCLTEVNESDYNIFEKCKETVNSLLL